MINDPNVNPYYRTRPASVDELRTKIESADGSWRDSLQDFLDVFLMQSERGRMTPNGRCPVSIEYIEQGDGAGFRCGYQFVSSSFTLWLCESGGLF
jgi:hypothetical protein